MTRTHIISADGTRFEEVTARTATRRKIARRLAWGVFFTAATIFLSAALIGLQRAAIEGSPDEAHPAPTATKAISYKAMQRACTLAPKAAKQDCMNLYLRNAWSDGKNFTPAGPALVKDCLSQYRGRELRDCFTQEIG